MPSLTFRSATAADVDRLVEIHQTAFADARGAEARVRNFTQNALGGLADLHVAVLDGALVAHAFSFPLKAWFGGERVPVSAIASVGVAPEARGCGVASGLLGHLHAVGAARGDAIALLYAFRHGFYAHHGYAPTSTFRLLSFSPAAVPAGWGGPESVRCATGADRPAIEGLYEQAASRGTGALVRPERAWDARFLDERRHFFLCARGEEPVGYVSFTLAQREAHAEVVLRVGDLVATDDAARRRLFALLRAQRDQVARVELFIDEDDPLPLGLVDADAWRFGTAAVEHTLGEVVAGPMVRVLDRARAVLARGYPAGGSAGDPALTLDVDGGALHLVVDQGRAVLLDAPPPGAARVRVSGPSLATLLYGGVRPSRAARIGLASGSPEALASADAILALPPYFSRDPF